MYQIVLSANTPRGVFQGVLKTDFKSPADASAYLTQFKGKLNQLGFVSIQTQRPEPTGRLARLDSQDTPGGLGEGGEVILPSDLLNQSVLTFSIREVRH